MGLIRSGRLTPRNVAAGDLFALSAGPIGGSGIYAVLDPAPEPEPHVLAASPILLIDQYRAPRAPRLNAMLRIFLDAVQRQSIDAYARMAVMRDLDRAEGVWLDRLGERIGIPRPSIVDQGDAFGFDDAGVGFDRGRMRDLHIVQPRSPVGDDLYRRLIKARGWTILSYGNRRYMELAVIEIDAAGVVTDLDDMSFRVTTSKRDDIATADRAGALPRPAGVRMIIADTDTFGFDDAGVGFDRGRMNTV